MMVAVVWRKLWRGGVGSGGVWLAHQRGGGVWDTARWQWWCAASCDVTGMRLASGSWRGGGLWRRVEAGCGSSMQWAELASSREAAAGAGAAAGIKQE